ncbi:hypothetical protein GCM10010411_64310 [Actinomadura fulvescens]|uniref:Uncharacterized protein n=1 Tax=Actinomadura fulvescens TaxID=46160 RepID=A0ABP6CH92_9ACTN
MIPSIPPITMANPLGPDIVCFPSLIATPPVLKSQPSRHERHSNRHRRLTAAQHPRIYQSATNPRLDTAGTWPRPGTTDA